jgi:2-aminoethylphosphonate-pyruvate transaminase
LLLHAHDRVRHAVVLAAGLGMRLRSIVDARPKGLIDIGGETLVGRSVRLLREAGIEHVTIVTGFCADEYQRFAAGQPDVDLVHNDGFATTGSMASLALALDRIDGDMLVLESDIVYEARALAGILGASAPDATLMSGPTGAGDEVWVCAPDGRLHTMSKSRGELAAIHGEFVGITRLSASTATAMRDAFTGFVETQGHGRMDYETDALVTVGRLRPIATVLVPDLVWGEVDDERQYTRVLHTIWPAVRAQSPLTA